MNCVCGHSRDDHRGVTRWAKIPMFDGVCQVPGCRCTDSGYRAEQS